MSRLRALTKDGRVVNCAARVLSRRDFAALRQWLADGGTDTLLVRADGVFIRP